MHNARNWRPVAQKAGRRRVTELGFAGWGVVMSHPALLFQRRPPGRNLRNPSVVRHLDKATQCVAFFGMPVAAGGSATLIFKN